ncbi:11193_t:CDS:2, partial [Gigaspora rosea]
VKRTKKGTVSQKRVLPATSMAKWAIYRDTACQRRKIGRELGRGVRVTYIRGRKVNTNHEEQLRGIVECKKLSNEERKKALAVFYEKCHLFMDSIQSLEKGT